ncbi:hypothetical protein [Chryseobacterium koreense]|uniref:hypothetical protein n=1 Tax=Chryseobacterium koreense TaxID=232216 RepID=UPI0026F35AB7|nr:hypothetical protein [Chryseobacterium koreense]
MPSSLDFTSRKIFKKMEFNIENLKRRSQNVADETRKGKNTAERIGGLFFDVVSEIDNVYRKINRRMFILCFISITISIISLILSIFKSDDITIDGANLLGVMVGILSFLVTLILGYQIYKTIEIEDLIEKKMNAIEKTMRETLKDYIDIKIEEKIPEK